MTEIKEAKKITVKDMGINPSECVDKGPVAAIHVEATGYFMKPTQFGDAVALEGDFTALNMLTGEVQNAAVLYLPGDYAATLANKLDKRSDSSETIIVDLQISVIKSERGGKGYTYIVKPIQTENVINRRLVALNNLQNVVKALPAPKKQETKQNKAA